MAPIQCCCIVPNIRVICKFFSFYPLPRFITFFRSFGHIIRSFTPIFPGILTAQIFFGFLLLAGQRCFSTGKIFDAPLQKLSFSANNRLVLIMAKAPFNVLVNLVKAYFKEQKPDLTSLFQVFQEELASQNTQGDGTAWTRQAWRCYRG